MIGVDTSFLVALTVLEQPDNEACRALFDAEIVGGNATMAVAGQVVVDGEVGVLFLAWMEQFRLGPKRLFDTLLAATFHRAARRVGELA